MQYLKTDRINSTASIIEIDGGATVQHSTNEDYGLLSFGDIGDIRDRMVGLARMTNEQLDAVVIKLGLTPNGDPLRQIMLAYEAMTIKEVVTAWGYELPETENIDG